MTIEGETKKRRHLLMGVSVFALATSMPQTYAIAQNAQQDAQQDEQDQSNEDTIVVTATKRAMSIQDVSQSITAIGTTQIEREALLNLADYQRAIPSLTFYATQPGRNQIIFRGISTGTNQFRTDSSTSVYFDEQPMTAISQQVDPRMIDIQRIEALPGPQGTLFGSSSQSGTIRYITNKPDPDSLSGTLEASFGSTKGGELSTDFNAILNVPLADTMAIRAVAFSAKDGGYIDNVLGEGLSGTYDNADVVEDNFNDWSAKGGRLSLGWEVAEGLDILATGMYEKSKTTGDWLTDPSVGDFQIVRFYDDRRDDEWWSAALTITADLGFAELVSATSYLDRKIVYEYDGSTYDAWRSNYYAYYSLYNTLDGKSVTVQPESDPQRQDRVTQEIRLTSQGDSVFQWMIGGFYEKVNDYWFWAVHTPDLENTPAAAYASYVSCYYAYYNPTFACPLDLSSNYWYFQQYDRSVSQVAAFGEVSLQVTDYLKFVGGMRWFEFTRERTEINQWPAGLPPASYTGGDFEGFGGLDIISGKDSDVVSKFGFQIDFDEDRMFYANYSEGFRLGGVNSFKAANVGFVPRIYGPDSLKNWEAGIKSTWFDNALTANISVFRMEWQDIQRTRFSDDIWWLNGNINGGGAVSEGIEANFSARPSDNLKLDLNLFAADAKLTDPILNEDDTIGVPTGTRLTFAPKIKYSFGIEYTIPEVFDGTDLWMRYDFWGQSDQLQNQWTGLTIPKHNESNVTIGLWAEGNWDATLAVNNVWNQKIISSYSTSENYAADFFGTNRYRDMQYLNRPRTAWLTFRKRI